MCAGVVLNIGVSLGWQGGHAMFGMGNFNSALSME
jgi:hypothetical protein